MDNVDVCAYCKKQLAGQETIWAMEGFLLCSRTCGVHSLAESTTGSVDSLEIAEEYFDNHAEEIIPADIGIV